MHKVSLILSTATLSLQKPVRARQQVTLSYGLRSPSPSHSRLWWPFWP